MDDKSFSFLDWELRILKKKKMNLWVGVLSLLLAKICKIFCYLSCLFLDNLDILVQLASWHDGGVIRSCQGLGLEHHRAFWLTQWWQLRQPVINRIAFQRLEIWASWRKWWVFRKLWYAWGAWQGYWSCRWDRTRVGCKYPGLIVVTIGGVFFSKLIQQHSDWVHAINLWLTKFILRIFT